MQTLKTNYRLLDFGMGRKLEQFGKFIVDRPCPGAASAKKSPSLWDQTDLSYGLKAEDHWHAHQRQTSRAIPSAGEWFCECDGVRMSLKPTPAGQVGVFPEHWSHWSWLFERLALDVQTPETRPRVLSLFAYTGATTLALAKAGCAVTHVDASKPTVAWARENCAHSLLGESSIRWIVDDAATFVKREIRRNSQYEAIILDPPTYGHGSKGTRWEIHRHLMPLLNDCWQLLSEHRKAILLCGHSSHIAIRDINAELAEKYGAKAVSNCEIHQANLIDAVGRKLDCGFAARYSL
jgi:23S rRNA (cytosine1962-C5)-methyltransferase